MYLLQSGPIPLLLPAPKAATLPLDTVTCADALAFLRTLPSESVHCVVTSPPYFGLRNYGVTGQMGLENSPAAFIAGMVALFREVRRVLRCDGTLWVNIGDSYVSSPAGTPSREYIVNESKGDGAYARRYRNNHQGTLDKDKDARQTTGWNNTGLPSKSLLMIPARLAIAMQDDGWILRSDIIWHKPNPMPESVTDRPTKSHEYVYLFAKSGRYWYDQEAIRETAVNGDPTSPRGSAGVTDNPLNAGRRDEFRNSSRYVNQSTAPSNHELTDKQGQLGKRTYTGFNERWDNRAEPLTRRNARSVWTIATEPTPFAHFATFPTALVERCVLAGCPAGGVILDPFMGSGTTALVARRLGRHYIGCDLNPEYVKLANDRLAQSDPFQSTVKPDGTVQLSLFEAVARD